jgi:hypothetical protein
VQEAPAKATSLAKTFLPPRCRLLGAPPPRPRRPPHAARPSAGPVRARTRAQAGTAGGSPAERASCVAWPGSGEPGVSVSASAVVVDLTGDDPEVVDLTRDEVEGPPPTG